MEGLSTFISCKGGLLLENKGCARAPGGAAVLSMTDSITVPPMAALTSL